MGDLGFGLWLTALGMGTVFGLLVLLMLALKLIGWTDQRGRRTAELPGEPTSGSGNPPDATAPQAAGELSPDELAAITIAVLTHARVRRQQAAPAMRAHEPGSHLFANRWVSIGRGHQQQSWTRGT